MKPGFPPAPAALKRLRGNPGRRPIPEEPVAEGAPVAPAGLPREVADRFALLVSRAPWCRASDSDLVLLCARALVRLDRLERSKKTDPIRLERLGDFVRKTLAELGLTPASRSRVHYEPPRPTDPADEFRTSWSN